MTGVKIKRLPHSIRAQFRARLVMQVEAECNILRAAGAPKKEVQSFVNEARRKGSPAVFNHLADYADAMMPKLLLNKSNWPAMYRKGDMVTQTPAELREDARTFVDEFVEEIYGVQPGERVPAPPPKPATITVAGNEPDAPPSPVRKPWEVRQLPEDQWTHIERLQDSIYQIRPEFLQRRVPELYRPLKLVMKYGYGPADWDLYYQSPLLKRALVIHQGLNAAFKESSDPETKQLCWAADKSLSAYVETLKNQKQAPTI